MSSQLATKYPVFTEEGGQESAFDAFLLPPFLDQFQEKLPPGQVASYLVDPEPDSFPSKQTTERDTETLKEPSSPPVIPFRSVQILQDTFLSLQKWEGTVLEVKEDAFLARLIDLTAVGPDEEAEFPIEEISKEDVKLLKPGAIFYWNIGYHDTSRGQRIRSSTIRFRRLPDLRESIGWK